MPNRNLELLTDPAELLRPLLDDLVFVGGIATALLITDQAAAEVRPRLTSMQSPRSPPTPTTWCSPRGFATSGSPRTPVKVRHSVAGLKPKPLGMSCHSTRRFSDSRIGGTNQPWNFPNGEH